MSISRNVGAFAKYLTSIRGNTTYLDVKKKVEQLLVNTPFVGEPIKNVLSASKTALKSVLYHSTMFEDMGFVYLVLAKLEWIEKLFGQGVIYVLRKFFGIILLAMAVKLFVTNISSLIG